jgi:RNA polymerase sigma-70 factor (ECF subfamily)
MLEVVRSKPMREMDAIDGEEEALVWRAQQGDLSAFDELVRRYRRAVWLVARQHAATAEIAEDVAQDSLLLAYKALPTLADPARFGGWLRAIARNRALRVAPSEARQVPTERTALDALLLRHSQHLANVAPSEEHAWIRDEVAELPEEIRQAMQLYYFEDWPVGRIARFFGLPVTTLKWRLHTGRLQLRKRLEAAGRKDPRDE